MFTRYFLCFDCDASADLVNALIILKYLPSTSAAYFYSFYLDTNRSLQVLIKEGSLPALVGSISSRELNCQRYSSLCLANLATTVAAQVKIIQCGAVRPLIAMGMNTQNQIEARRYAVLALASKN